MKPSVQCETTKGPIDIVLQPEWSPKGVARFEELVRANYFDQMPLFRCVDDFLCQFGYKEEPAGTEEWPEIEDDPRGGDVPRRFKRGFVSFAGGGRNSRNSHLFVTLGRDVHSLGTEPWETPIGYVTDESMLNAVSKWTTKYGDMPPWGKGPDPSRIARVGGQEYLKKGFPDLDYIISCKMVEEHKPALTTKVQVALELGPNLGRVVLELEPEWSPKGVQRFLEMIDVKFLDEARFFRVVPGFVVQFGLPADPKRGKEFGKIQDDQVISSNVKGTITFATAGPSTRTTQLFINTGNNARLDGMGFSPIGRIVQGMEYIERINAKYREQPDQGMITKFGNEYLDKNFPDLSYIRTARLITHDAALPFEAETNKAGDTNDVERVAEVFEHDDTNQVVLITGVALVLFAAYLFIVRRLVKTASTKVN